MKLNEINMAAWERNSLQRDVYFLGNHTPPLQSNKKARL